MAAIRSAGLLKEAQGPGLKAVAVLNRYDLEVVSGIILVLTPTGLRRWRVPSSYRPLANSGIHD
jgi:hypothetical protein